ncbi:MAG: hypothetical protein PHG66_01930 [Candidatus Colwellbacteria bacterium]|nr:hypothetical protein [Candidatus Colwellbacteria bacterium]
MTEEQKETMESVTRPVFTLDQCEKKPDNPLFAEEKRKQQDYIDGLQQQVDYLRMKDPAKYQKYQAIGESLMDCTYEPISGVDAEGDNMTAQRLLYVVRDYGEEELSKEELTFLIRVYGRDWRRERLEEL